MKQFHTRKAQGFTLVELAIVITIIGILIGGVLKGQQLIDQARIAGTISQMRDYQSAVMIFKTTYNALPGDMPNPDERIVGCTNCAAQGETLGDNLINGSNISVSNWDVTKEPIRFWLHLYKAKMISGISDAALTQTTNALGETIPAAKLSDGFYVESASGWCSRSESVIVFGSCQPVGLTLMIVPPDIPNLGDHFRHLKVAAVAQIDRKMDDGKPLTGDVRGIGRKYGMDRGCLTAGGDTYPESLSKADLCTLGFVLTD